MYAIKKVLGAYHHRKTVWGYEGQPSNVTNKVAFVTILAMRELFYRQNARAGSNPTCPGGNMTLLRASLQ